MQKKSIIKKLKLWQRKGWFCLCKSACFCVSLCVYLLLCGFVCGNVSTRINARICLYTYVLLFVRVSVYETAKIWFKSFNKLTQKYNCTQCHKHITHMYNITHIRWHTKLHKHTYTHTYTKLSINYLHTETNTDRKMKQFILNMYLLRHKHTLIYTHYNNDLQNDI